MRTLLQRRSDRRKYRQEKIKTLSSKKLVRRLTNSSAVKTVTESDIDDNLTTVLSETSVKSSHLPDMFEKHFYIRINLARKQDSMSKKFTHV